MHRTRLLLFAIGVSFWPAIACAQSGATELPATLRAHLKEERLGMVTSIRGLPLGVREELQTLFGNQLELNIAEPGAKFQVTDVVTDAMLPLRRLVLAGCSMDHCLVYYERGGITHSWHAALFHWTPAATKLEFGGMAPRGLASIDEVRSAVLSGAVKGSGKVW